MGFLGGFVPTTIKRFTLGEVKEILAKKFRVDQKSVSISGTLDHLGAVDSNGNPVEEFTDKHFIIDVVVS